MTTTSLWRQVELAELLEVQPITLTRQLESLALTHIIERRLDPRDKRAYCWYLTSAATPELERIAKRAEQIRQHALAGLSEHAAKQLTASLQTVRHNLSLGSPFEAQDDSEQLFFQRTCSA